MNSDALQRFIFNSAPARGAHITLNNTWKTVLSQKNYPRPIANALGELLAASAMLGSMLKFSGSLVLQLQGSGALKLLIVEWNADRTLRATAKWTGELNETDSLKTLLGHGQFVVILDAKNGQAPYQGVVPLSGDCVAHMLEEYMARSEQLDTRLCLACDEDKACGFLLQRLPEGGQGDLTDWQRLDAFMHTLSREELLTTDLPTLRHRLFHEESLQVFEFEAQHFSCSCSHERVSDMLKMLGRDEIDSVLAEEGSIEVTCDYCTTRYVFDEKDISELFCPTNTKH